MYWGLESLCQKYLRTGIDRNRIAIRRACESKCAKDRNRGQSRPFYRPTIEIVGAAPQLTLKNSMASV